MRVFIILLFTLSVLGIEAQGVAELYGKVKNDEGEYLIGVTIRLQKGNELLSGVLTDSTGSYKIKAPLNQYYRLHYSYVGMDTLSIPIKKSKVGKYKLNIELSPIRVGPIEVKGKSIQSSTSYNEEHFENQTGPIASIENMLVTGGGATKNDETSSSYSVRGGSFDENLVYLNDFQIYRPQLTRSGIQEGLSILNPTMVSNVEFFAGGFAANYGDKMSSALDVHYRKPKQFGAQASVGMLGFQGTVEGTDSSKNFTYLLGFRNQRNSYLLNSLDVSGSYQPIFYDFQAYLTQKLSKKWSADVLLYYADNDYVNIPETKRTRLGNVRETVDFLVAFQGQEISNYNTYLGGTKFTYTNNESYTFKWLTSAFRSLESETYDVIGEYWLSEVETNLGSDDFGNPVNAIGVGGFHNFARNYLDIQVFNTEIKNTHFIGRQLSSSDLKISHNIQWGIKLQREVINDQIHEWTRIDSAGYSIPYNTDQVLIDYYLSDRNQITSNRVNLYLMDEVIRDLEDVGEFGINYGVRSTYWDFNEQLNISPRAQLYWKPNWEEKPHTFRLSSGVYHQPPFYRELRRLTGGLNSNVLAQRAIHLSLGSERHYEMWGRPFVFSSEVYYKWLDQLNTYEIDNVRIRYYANNEAKGYARGVDFRVNGEFVEGAESWFSLSFLDTKEDILTDKYPVYYNDTMGLVNPIVDGYDNVASVDTVYPGFVPRPTDQLMTFNIFFQDHVRDNENIKVHLNFILGTGFKFGPPDNNRYKDTLQLPMYRRVDLGFSGLLFEGRKHQLSKYKNVESLWATVEIFNLLDVRNTVSYLWIRDRSSKLYAVPNHLTRRLLNVKLVLKL